MADGQAAPKKGMNPILKWLLIGCGTIVLLMILVFAGCSYFVYSKAKEAKAELKKQGVTIDTTHGFKGLAYSTTVAAIQGMKPGVLLALPAPDRPAADKAFQDLSAKSGSFTDQDMQDLGKAMDDYNKANAQYHQAHGTPLNPEAARKFVEDIQAIADRH